MLKYKKINAISEPLDRSPDSIFLMMVNQNEIVNNYGIIGPVSVWEKEDESCVFYCKNGFSNVPGAMKKLNNIANSMIENQSVNVEDSLLSGKLKKNYFNWKMMVDSSKNSEFWTRQLLACFAECINLSGIFIECNKDSEDKDVSYILNKLNDIDFNFVKENTELIKKYMDSKYLLGVSETRKKSKNKMIAIQSEHKKYRDMLMKALAE